jgi:hypothetical protein
MLAHGASTRQEITSLPGEKSTHRQRGVHFPERLVDDYFSIVVGNSVDGIVYFHAAPLHLALSLICSQLFGFLVSSRIGIVIGHDKALPFKSRYTL